MLSILVQYRAGLRELRITTNTASGMTILLLTVLQITGISKQAKQLLIETHFSVFWQMENAYLFLLYSNLKVSSGNKMNETQDKGKDIGSSSVMAVLHHSCVCEDTDTHWLTGRCYVKVCLKSLDMCSLVSEWENREERKDLTILTDYFVILAESYSTCQNLK